MGFGVIGGRPRRRDRGEGMNPRARGARMVWEGHPAMPVTQLFPRTSSATSHRPEPTAGAAASAEAGGSVLRSASQTPGFRRDAPGLATCPHPALGAPGEERDIGDPQCCHAARPDRSLATEPGSPHLQYTGSASSPLPDSWLLDVVMAGPAPRPPPGTPHSHGHGAGGPDWRRGSRGLHSTRGF